MSFKIARISDEAMSFSFMYCLCFRKHLHIRYVKEINPDVKLYLLMILFDLMKTWKSKHVPCSIYAEYLVFYENSD